MPKPEEGQVLIKGAYSTINHSDKFFVNMKNPLLGSEGSGIILEVGNGVDKALIGKKVCYFSNTYCVYKAVDLSKCQILDDSQDLR
jgi:NADPH:quinone reductase-like Zn-dependent oxidoreductase